MGNIQGVLIPCGALLTLNCLNAEEQTAAPERHWIVEGTAEFNQFIYFRDILASKWKPECVLCWGRGYAFVSTGNKKLWISSKLIEIRFD